MRFGILSDIIEALVRHSQAQKCLQINSINLLRNFKNSYLTDFSADWLTIWLMSSDKRNSITAKAIGLISSLFNIASSWDVPFRQPLQLQCSYHDSTKTYLCSPFLSPLPRRWRFVVAPLCGFMEDLVTAVIAKVLLLISFCKLLDNTEHKA